ncbi:hypothetical protein GCM10007147_44890 [Nocardiopsis kunsanensis]|uniref:DUF4097 domain-containing protein n=1 Tax=Nocardiopsis kunsanensis TaxID=141693 RepID=A0A918XLC1_9ACTN|nr:DUF4097 family beta strand repeat-containing protein [Nocardiopsis kunsanensis]GHD37107.1 hypothetical protein GCM10007147_44890 [Nocardiopsis kunsanensis]
MHATHTVPADQLETLALTATAAQVRVIASEETVTATLDISGPDEIVRGAQVAHSGGMWSLHLPEPTITAGGGNVTNVVSGGGTVVSGGTVIINGNLVSGAVQQGHITEPVTVTVRVPRGIRLSTTVNSGSLRTTGYIREVAAWATSGNVHVATAGSVQVSTTSGDITVSHADTKVVAAAHSGDVDVRGGADIEVSTTSGDISFVSTRACRLSASATSGDITLVRQHDVQANVSTTSGDISG